MADSLLWSTTSFPLTQELLPDHNTFHKNNPAIALIGSPMPEIRV
jgi:hypothetical protein